MADITGLKPPKGTVLYVPELAKLLDALIDALEERDAEIADAIEGLGGDAGPVKFKLTGYEAVDTYPATAGIRKWTDCGGAGGEVVLPDTDALTPGEMCGICNTSSGSISVTGLINGESSFTLTQQYEHYSFFWTGQEWRVWG